jgi:hypothetical protein
MTVIVGRFEQKIALELLEAEEFPVNFPDSWEFRCRDRFDSDYVRHHLKNLPLVSFIFFP